MASTYTDLGIELMATGENAGTWGTKTNNNLSLFEQLTGGFNSQAVTDSGTPTALTIVDGETTGTAQHRMIELTGTISGARVVTIPLDVETFYYLRNSTSGAYTVQFKYVSGSGDSHTFSATDKGDAILFATANDGTNPDIYKIATGDVTLTGTQTLTNKTLTSPKIGTSILDTSGNELALLTATGSAVNEFTIANAATGAGPTLSSTGGDSNIDINITPKGTGDVVLAGDTVKVGDSGAAAVLTSNGAGTLTVTTGGASDLVLSTNSGTDSGTITITDAADGNINIAPNGNGVVQAGGSAVKVAGKETIWVPAIAMYPTTTNGAEAAQTELTAGQPELKSLDFDKDSDEFAQFAIAFPKSWNEGTVTFQPFFTANTTNTGSAKFIVAGVAVADDGPIDVGFGTGQGTAIGFSGTANDLMVGNESAAITIAGSPAAGEQVFFNIFRDVSADNLTADAKLLGIKLFFTTDAANDA